MNFPFDAVYSDELQIQDYFYDAEIATIVEDFICKDNITIILCGLSGSGMNRILYGESEFSFGILYRSIEKLLQRTTPFIKNMDIKLYDYR